MGGHRYARRRFIFGACQVRWMSDDDFIYIRAVNQLYAGIGPAFNAVERVETGAGPLGTAVLAIERPLTGIALQCKAVVTGIVLAAAGLLAAQRAGVRLARAESFRVS